MYSISESLNTAYSVQILTTIITILFTFLSTLYFWIHKQIKNDWGGEIGCKKTYMAFAVGLLLIHGGQLVYLVLFCSRTAREVCPINNNINKIIHLFKANRSGYLIHNIYYPASSINSQILHFSGQLLHNTSTFTACNLFELNESLLCSVSQYYLCVCDISISLYLLIDFSLLVQLLRIW